MTAKDQKAEEKKANAGAIKGRGRGRPPVNQANVARAAEAEREKIESEKFKAENRVAAAREAAAIAGFESRPEGVQAVPDTSSAAVIVASTSGPEEVKVDAATSATTAFDTAAATSPAGCRTVHNNTD